MHIAPTLDPTTLLWFTQDLRLHDNAAIEHVNQLSDDHKHRLVCLYCIDSTWFEKDHFGNRSMGERRWQFLLESLRELAHGLQKLGQQLIVAKGIPSDIIDDILSRYAITTVVASQQTGYHEQQTWASLKAQHAHLPFVNIDTFTLFSESQLPFSSGQLPTSFSQFRQSIESNDETQQALQSMGALLTPMPQTLPSVLHITLREKHQYRVSADSTTSTYKTFHGFSGGEQQGWSQLKEYFSGNAPSHYKETRNALGCEKEEWQLSSKFSAWLANGCLSARQIVSAVNDYEQQHGANQSTYWIVFELLWREYFQCYAHQHGRLLFFRKGLQKKAPLASFYPQRFQQWCHGNTPWPLVNACMKQLNQTGFLSNRGRQIVASCLIYELDLDWRCGAAYFEQQLVDYDVAANWGNWQYIAGVGADPRGGRRFNIEKQQQLYDPEKRFITHWQGEADTAIAIDSVDAADWPLS